VVESSASAAISSGARSASNACSPRWEVFLGVRKAAVAIDDLILGPFDRFIEQREAPQPLRLGGSIANGGPYSRRRLEAGQDRGDAGVAEDGEVLAQQLRACLREIRHAAEIEDQQRCVRRLAGEAPCHVVDGCEIERPDKLDDANVAVVLVEDLLLVRLAAAAGGYPVEIVIRDDAGANIGVAVEHMQIETRRQRFANLQAPDAVEVAVEARRKRAETELGRKCRDDAAADAALGGDPDAIDPFAGIIVHARTGHDRKRAGDGMRRDHLRARHRVDAAIGQCAGHNGEIAGGDEDRALPEIGVEHGVDIILQHTE
jgi:hypothetical protein